MDVETQQADDTIDYAKRARFWDKVVTVVLVSILFLPFPFVRIKAWPVNNIISEHLIMPWSHLRICYLSFPDGEAVEENYRFTWKGKIAGVNSPQPLVLTPKSLEPPFLKWQEMPERSLSKAFYEGDLLKVETFWQPLLFWPLKMVWGTSRNVSGNR